MVQIVWTQQARNDLEDIFLFISRDSDYYAQQWAKQVLDKVDLLVSFPKLGRVVPEKDDKSIRELVIGKYRLIYALDDDVVYLLTLRHGAMLLDDL